MLLLKHAEYDIKKAKIAKEQFTSGLLRNLKQKSPLS